VTSIILNAPRTARALVAFVVACMSLALGQAPPPVADAEVSAVRVLRIGPDDRPHDVWLGGTSVAVELGRGGLSAYVVVPAGTSEVGVAPSGEEDSAGPPSRLGEVEVPAASYVTLIVSGAVASDASDADGGASDERATRGPVLIEDPLTELPPAGHAGLRLVHAGSEPSALRLAARRFEAPPGEPPQDADDPPEETSYVARVESMRGSAYATVEAGRQRVWLVREDGTQALPRPLEISLRAGTLYSLFVTPGSSGSRRVSVAIDASSSPADAPAGDGPSSLRVLHASPDAPLVDVLVDGMSRLRDVAPGTVTPYTNVTTGTHLLEVYPHRLPSPMTDPGRSAESGEAPTGEGADAGEGGPAQAAPEASTSAPRLEPVTALVDLPEGRYTTLVLAGRYEPAASTAEMGGLSVSVEPADASVTVQGPEGDVVAGRPGPKLLDGLAPGTYRVEVQKEGYRPARYEVEVSPDTTAVLSVTLQRTSDAEDEGGEGPGDAEDPQQAGPDFVNLAAPEAERRSLELHVYPTSIPIASPGAARVRFVHVAPSVPSLDIVASRPPEGEAQEADRSASDVATVDALAYPNAAEYVRVEAGTTQLTFRVAGSANRLRRLEVVELRPGTSYTFFLVARSPSLRFSVVPTVDAIAPQRRPDRGGR
jgi:hypothetical protein